MYEPSETRYETMPYNRCGKSGLRLPALSVGLWQNFGVNNDYDTMKEIILTPLPLSRASFSSLFFSTVRSKME